MCVMEARWVHKSDGLAIISPGNHGGAGAVCVGNTFSVRSVCREKRRLELERELFAYSRSDKRA